jgi:hypothetical protein
VWPPPTVGDAGANISFPKAAETNNRNLDTLRSAFAYWAGQDSDLREQAQDRF